MIPEITPRDLLPEGLEDRLAPATTIAARLTRAVMDVLDAHGYDRVQPPSLEFETALASRMAGIRARRLFRFLDPASLRMLALRGDITPQLGRVAVTRLAGATRPLRLAYAGQVLSITGDDLEPAREKLQLGAEIIGSDSVTAASEVVTLAVEALSQAGARGIAIDFTLPDLVVEVAAGPLPLAPDQIAMVRRELDAKDAGGLVAAGGAAYLPLLYAAGPLEDALAALAGLGLGPAIAARLTALREIATAVTGAVAGAARLSLDPTDRHGFAYQSWFGFTIYVEGMRRPLGRGGTYRILGAPSCPDGEPATGFSLYPDPLIDALSAQEPARRALFLPLGHDAAAAARHRGQGWRTVAALSASDDPIRLACTHRLDGDRVVAL